MDPARAAPGLAGLDRGGGGLRRLERHAWQMLGAPVDVSDAVFSLVHDADPTKKALFNLSGLSAGTTRTYSCRTPRASSRSSPARRPSPGRRPSPAR
jgi:hypothetical protein